MKFSYSDIKTDVWRKDVNVSCWKNDQVALIASITILVYISSFTIQNVTFANIYSATPTFEIIISFLVEVTPLNVFADKRKQNCENRHPLN